MLMISRNSMWWLSRAALTVTVTLSCLPFSLSAQSQSRVPRPSIRLSSARGPVHLDGRLDEAAWLDSDSATSFLQVEPREKGAPSMRTIVRVLSTGDAIVFGIRVDDDEPAKIVSFSRQRDASLASEDHIKLVLDTYLDGRSGYVFTVNAAGARYDALVANQGEGENSNWDAIWEAATSRDSHGWSVEISLPLKSLLFKPGLTEWGLNVERRIQRLQETDRWAGAERNYNVTQTSRAGLLTEIPAYHLGAGLTVRPSLTGGGARDSAAAAFRKSGHASLDVTQRLGPNTLGSLTVNTDFAETEVDARRVNLTRFSLFFPEKRTFFLEGSDIFDFGLGLTSDLDVLPFFSRRIGLLEGKQVPIGAGLKVNGRMGGSSFGALTVRTRQLDSVAEPATMSVLRLKKDVLSESYVGMIATAGDPLNRSGSWLAGPDLTYQTSRFRGDKNLLIGLWGLMTGREDLDDRDRTAAGIKIDYPNDLWDIAVKYKRIGDAFDPSLGFVPRAGVHIVNAGADWQPRPQRAIGRLHIRQCFVENQFQYVAGLTGGWQSYELFLAPINCRLESGDRFEANVVPVGERLTEPFEVADGVAISPGAYHYNRYRVEAAFAAKRRVSGQVTWWFGRFYNGHLDEYEITGSWKPSPLLILEISGERNVGNVAHRRFVQELIGTRVRVNISPDLQVNTFVQYDNETESLGTNTRLRWTFTPLGDLFIVYNHNLTSRDRVGRRQSLLFESNQLAVKLQYTFRY